MSPNLFPRGSKKGFLIFSSSKEEHWDAKTGATKDSRLSIFERKPFYRLYYRNGLLTLERYQVTSRIYFSFHHRDRERLDRILGMRKRRDTAASFEAHQWRIGFGRDRYEKWADRAGKVEGDSKWERITRGGPRAVKRWIRKQMRRKGCLIVLIGSQTANRPWVNYEIREGWNDLRGVVGVYIHNIKDKHGRQSPKGENPFNYLMVGGRPMSEIAQTYDPLFQESKEVFNQIEQNLPSWVREAIKIRNSTAAEAEYSGDAATID